MHSSLVILFLLIHLFIFGYYIDHDGLKLYLLDISLLEQHQIHHGLRIVYVLISNHTKNIKKTQPDRRQK